MSRIVFFSIPAYGHTNPTIEVICELVSRGNTVRYYSFSVFQDKIEDTGAEFIPCDKYLPPAPEDLDKRCRYDFSSFLAMAADVTINMENQVKKELRDFRPDCIVSDSLCIWGKLFAESLQIPMVCSTTTFAFNHNTAKLMKARGKEVFYTILGLPRIYKILQRLKDHGYPVSNMAQILKNDEKTPTIVYTSRTFQPMSEEFGSNYAFVGPSIHICESPEKGAAPSRPLIYISLGTVMKNKDFYKECISALKDSDYDVVMTVGSQEILKDLGNIPTNFRAEIFVPQLEILQKADVFLTHCGMNSVHESISLGVPMILWPQQSEEQAVANRLCELGVGVPLKKPSSRHIRDCVAYVLNHRQALHGPLMELADSFRTAGGAGRAAEVIEGVCRGGKQE